MSLSESAVGRVWNKSNDVVEGTAWKGAKLAAKGVRGAVRLSGKALKGVGTGVEVVLDRGVVRPTQRVLDTKVARKTNDVVGSTATGTLVGAGIGAGIGFAVAGPIGAPIGAKIGGALTGATVFAEKSGIGSGIRKVAKKARMMN